MVMRSKTMERWRRAADRVRITRELEGWATFDVADARPRAEER